MMEKIWYMYSLSYGSHENYKSNNSWENTEPDDNHCIKSASDPSRVTQRSSRTASSGGGKQTWELCLIILHIPFCYLPLQIRSNREWIWYDALVSNNFIVLTMKHNSSLLNEITCIRQQGKRS